MREKEREAPKPRFVSNLNLIASIVIVNRTKGVQVLCIQTSRRETKGMKRWMHSPSPSHHLLPSPLFPSVPSLPLITHHICTRQASNDIQCR